MSKRALWNAPHVRLSLIPMALAVSLAIAGCGGGGGGSSSGGTTTTTTTGTTRSNPTLATVTGTVTAVDSASTPISGATVEIAGTSLVSKPTDSAGQFVIYNVPVGTVGITVLRPAGGQYTTIVSYGPSGSAQQYNDTAACPIPLVTKASGTAQTPTTVPYSIQLYSSASPPAPPLSGANGCPQ